MKLNELIKNLQHFSKQGYGEDEVMIYETLFQDCHLTTVEEIEIGEMPVENKDGKVIILLP